MFFFYSYTKLSDIYRTELTSELNIAFSDCVRHHQMIKSICVDLENMTSTFILVKSIEASFQICVLALTFMKVKFIRYDYILRHGIN